MFVGTDKDYTAGMKFSFTPKVKNSLYMHHGIFILRLILIKTTPNEGEHPYGAFGYRI